MKLTFGGRDYDLNLGESVLDGMARHGIVLPSACRTGSCQACLVRAVRGDPGEEARRGLKPTWQESGYFLACLARPASDLVIAQPDGDIFTSATVAAVDWLGTDVMRVTLRPDRPLDFRPGQHVTLTRDGGVTRSYSVANLPGEAKHRGMEFHVRAYQNGAMSGWLARASPGARLSLGTPAGECFYVPDDRAGALLLAGTGTGIAPLVAIARDAAAQGHAGPIVIIHGAATRSHFYLGTRRPDVLAGAPGTAWCTCALSDGQDIAAAVTRELAALSEQRGRTRAYLCGGPGAVHRMRRALFMAGMSLTDIFADQFTAALT